MKIIIALEKKNHKKTHLMLELPDKKEIDKVKTLIHQLKCKKAISNILARGRFIKEVAEKDLVSEPSDLILTNSNAYWNLI